MQLTPKIFKFFSFLLIVLFALLSPFGTNTASSESNISQIDIMTTPEKVLFDTTNLKPGDWATRNLLIKNNGKEDFEYLFSSKLKSGSEKFFNELLIVVSDQKGELFNGKLKDFKKLEPRFLPRSAEEELTIRVDVPEHLGNDFQGLTSEVEFKFYVEGTLGGILPVDGPKLPETASSIFNYVLIGLGLIISGIILFILSRRKLESRY